MEALIFALIATRVVYRQQEAPVPELPKLPPFDLQALTPPEDIEESVHIRPAQTEGSRLLEVEA